MSAAAASVTTPFATSSLAITGICLGVLALWLSIPPFTLRNLVVPAAVAVLGAALGLWALTRGERKLGWWGVGVAIIAIACAIWFQNEAATELESVFSIGLVAATLRFATLRLAGRRFDAFFGRLRATVGIAAAIGCRGSYNITSHPPGKCSIVVMP